MGAVQPQLAEAVPYSVEMRGESFYLRSWHETSEAVHVPRRDGQGVLVLAVGDLPALHTALLQAQAWVRENMPRPVPGWKPGIVEWMLYETGDHEAEISGPWVGGLYVSAAGPADEPRMQVQAEISYADMPGLVALVGRTLRHALDGDGMVTGGDGSEGNPFILDPNGRAFEADPRSEGGR
ncbi:hypothetical protein ACWD2L_00670 [Streptomyces sp. NPDC002754]